MRHWMRLLESAVPIWANGLMYHGTARDNRGFRENRVAYFTDDIDDAKEHALMDASVDGETPYIIQVKLNIHNTVRIDTILMQDLNFNPEKVTELQSLGYDSAIGTHTGEIVVFDNKNIEIKKIIEVEDD
jgi:hypothetical protein